MSCDVSSSRTSSPQPSALVRTALTSSPTNSKSSSKSKRITKSFAMEYLLAASSGGGAGGGNGGAGNTVCGPGGLNVGLVGGLGITDNQHLSLFGGKDTRSVICSSNVYGITQQLSQLSQLSQQLTLPQLYSSCLLSGLPPPILPSIYGHGLPHYGMTSPSAAGGVGMAPGLNPHHLLGINGFNGLPRLGSGPVTGVDVFRTNSLMSGAGKDGAGSEETFSPSSAGDFANTSDSDHMEHDKSGQFIYCIIYTMGWRIFDNLENINLYRCHHKNTVL